MIEPRYFNAVHLPNNFHFSHTYAMEIMNDYPDEFYCGNPMCIPMNDIEFIGQIINEDAEW